MAWTYSLQTGLISHDGGTMGSAQTAAATGASIPPGQYLIGAARLHPMLGPHAMLLRPIGHDAGGRSGFMIHGGSARFGEGEVGIVADEALRLQIAHSGDTQLFVVR